MSHVEPGRARSSLDHQETKSPHEEHTYFETLERRKRQETTFRHGGWRNMRERIRQSLTRQNAGNNRLRRWDECGRFAWLVRDRNNEDRFGVRAAYCHDRFCVPCGRAKALTYAHNVAEHAKDRSVRFLTLTQQSTTEGVRELLDRLYDRFRRLRNRRQWQSHVIGGVAFLEVKYNPKLDRWNVHLHTLIEGRYFDHALIRSMWKEVTGDSWIIDVRALGSREAAVAYVTKYAAKAIDAQTTHYPDKLDEAVAALAGRRTCTTFGSWRGLRLAHAEPDGQWDHVMPLTQLFEMAETGDAYALHVLEHLRRNPHQPRLSPSARQHAPPVSSDFARRQSVYAVEFAGKTNATRTPRQHIEATATLFRDRDPRY